MYDIVNAADKLTWEEEWMAVEHSDAKWESFQRRLSIIEADTMIKEDEEERGPPRIPYQVLRRVIGVIRENLQAAVRGRPPPFMVNRDYLNVPAEELDRVAIVLPSERFNLGVNFPPSGPMRTVRKLQIPPRYAHMNPNDMKRRPGAPTQFKMSQLDLWHKFNKK